MNLLYKDESYRIIGICMDVHRILGKGLNEVVYKDALEYELNLAQIQFSRENRYKITYKETILRHQYIADFVIENIIILEIKAVENLMQSHIKQTLNYLAASGLKLGLLINFGEDSLSYKRIIL